MARPALNVNRVDTKTGLVPLLNEGAKKRMAPASKGPIQRSKSIRIADEVGTALTLVAHPDGEAQMQSALRRLMTTLRKREFPAELLRQLCLVLRDKFERKRPPVVGDASRTPDDEEDLVDQFYVRDAQERMLFINILWTVIYDFGIAEAEEAVLASALSLLSIHAKERSACACVLERYAKTPRADVERLFDFAERLLPEALGGPTATILRVLKVLAEVGKLLQTKLPAIAIAVVGKDTLPRFVNELLDLLAGFPGSEIESLVESMMGEFPVTNPKRGEPVLRIMNAAGGRGCESQWVFAVSEALRTPCQDLFNAAAANFVQPSFQQKRFLKALRRGSEASFARLFLVLCQLAGEKTNDRAEVGSNGLETLCTARPDAFATCVTKLDRQSAVELPSMDVPSDAEPIVAADPDLMKLLKSTIERCQT